MKNTKKVISFSVDNLGRAIVDTHNDLRLVFDAKKKTWTVIQKSSDEILHESIQQYCLVIANKEGVDYDDL